MEVLKRAVRMMREMMQQPAIQQYIAKELLPGESVQK